jgi:hypothetical protein
METWKQVKMKETEDFLWLLKGAPSRFIEGAEYVKVKRNITDKETHFILRSSIVTSWK